MFSTESLYFFLDKHVKKSYHDLQEFCIDNNHMLYDVLASFQAVFLTDDLQVLADSLRVEVHHCLGPELEDVRFHLIMGCALDEHLVRCIDQLDSVLENVT